MRANHILSLTLCSSITSTIIPGSPLFGQHGNEASVTREYVPITNENWSERVGNSGHFRLLNRNELNQITVSPGPSTFPSVSPILDWRPSPATYSLFPESAFDASPTKQWSLGLNGYKPMSLDTLEASPIWGPASFPTELLLSASPFIRQSKLPRDYFRPDGTVDCDKLRLEIIHRTISLDSKSEGKSGHKSLKVRMHEQIFGDPNKRERYDVVYTNDMRGARNFTDAFLRWCPDEELPDEVFHWVYEVKPITLSTQKDGSAQQSRPIEKGIEDSYSIELVIPVRAAVTVMRMIGSREAIVAVEAIAGAAFGATDLAADPVNDSKLEQSNRNSSDVKNDNPYGLPRLP